MLALKAHLKSGDREKHGWNSSGVVQKTIKKCKQGEAERISVSLVDIFKMPAMCRPWILF